MLSPWYFQFDLLASTLSHFCSCARLKYVFPHIFCILPLVMWYVLLWGVRFWEFQKQTLPVRKSCLPSCGNTYYAYKVSSVHCSGAPGALVLNVFFHFLPTKWRTFAILSYWSTMDHVKFCRGCLASIVYFVSLFCAVFFPASTLSLLGCSKGCKKMTY